MVRAERDATQQDTSLVVKSFSLPLIGTVREAQNSNIKNGFILVGLLYSLNLTNHHRGFLPRSSIFSQSATISMF
jgi:hypothetical protein